LRSLSAEQRNTYLTRFAGELDPEVLLAALETVNFPWQKAEQHFISAKTRQALTRHLVAAQNPGELESLDELSRALDYVSPTSNKRAAKFSASSA
jgi:hypothetical protein